MSAPLTAHNLDLIQRRYVRYQLDSRDLRTPAEIALAGRSAAICAADVGVLLREVERLTAENKRQRALLDDMHRAAFVGESP